MYLPAVIGGLAYAAASAATPYPYAPQPYLYAAPPPVVYAAPPPVVVAPPPVVYVQPDPTIRYVQSSLNILMRAGLVADGIPGPATVSAIQSYQASRGLVADGIAGPATMAVLRDELHRA